MDPLASTQSVDPRPEVIHFLQAFHGGAAAAVEALEAEEPDQQAVHAHHTSAMIALGELRSLMDGLIDEAFPGTDNAAGNANGAQASLMTLELLSRRLEAQRAEVRQSMVAQFPEFSAVSDQPKLPSYLEGSACDERCNKSEHSVEDELPAKKLRLGNLDTSDVKTSQSHLESGAASS